MSARPAANGRRLSPTSGSVLLEAPDMVWRVESGAGELLATRLENGHPTGARIPLGRVREGEIIVSLTDETAEHDRALILLGPKELRLVEHSGGAWRDDIRGTGRDPDAAQDRWASTVATLLVGTMRPLATETLSEGRTRTLSSEQIVAPEQGSLIWVEIEEGSGNLLGSTEMRVDAGTGPFPLPTQLWVRAAEGLRIRALPPEATDPATRAAGLLFLNRAIRRELRRRWEREEELEQERLESRERAEQDQIDTALRRMGSVLNPQPVVRRVDGALLAAASRVGDVLGVRMRTPGSVEELSRVADPIEAIARTSHVRMRHVALTGRWWRDDCGALIAYRDDGDPVALVPRPNRGYLLFDPATGAEHPIDAEEAAGLDPNAVLLYRPFPADLNRPRGLVPFALHGRVRDILFIVTVAVLATLLGMLVPQATALVLDQAIPNADRGQLTELGAALIAAALGVALLRYTQGLAAIRLSSSTDVDSQSAMWDRLLRLRVSFFKKYSTGDLLNRATAVSDVSAELNGATMLGMVTGVVSLLNFGLLLYYSVPLAGMAAGLALLVVVVTIGSGLMLRRINERYIEHQGEFYGTVVQLVNAVTKIQVAGAERRAFALWMDGHTRILGLLMRIRTVIDSVAIFNLALPVLSTILLYGLGARFLVPGGELGTSALSVGSFLAFQVALAMFLGGAATLSNMGVGLLDTLIRARRMEPILEAEPEILGTSVDPGTLHGEIAAHRVHFRYSEDGPKVLEDVSIRVEPGEFIAIVGGSGSGKSTLLRLLLGFERPQSGEILFDDQNLETLDPTAVRRQVGVVLQSSHIQAGSIYENIGGGAVVSLAEAWRAAEDAGLADDIRSLPMEMHTVISEGAGNLSGGQRQRLMICRALVRSPRILFLDEATSALDNRSQQVVTESLARRRVTRVVIAHRLSTVRHADRIYVLDRGRITEEGTHSELMSRGGGYAGMMARQQA